MTVYQYEYDNHTLNFHEYIWSVSEYIYETYSEVHYEAEALDELFINTLNKYHVEVEVAAESDKLLAIEDVGPSINDETTNTHD